MSLLIPIERQDSIVSLIKERGVVKVSELSKLFAVSVLTIRRDLAFLEEKGVLERSHGGAVLRRKMSLEPLYSHKTESGINEKKRIAKTVLTLINEHETLFINSGSTTGEIIRLLDGIDVRIITNNIEAVVSLKNSKPEVILIGGQYRTRSMSTVGQSGLNQIDCINADKAIIGSDGFSFISGLTTPNQAQADITKKMIEKTMGSVIAVSDNSKIGVISNFKTADLSDIDILVTDKDSEDLIDKEKISLSNVKLILV